MDPRWSEGDTLALENVRDRGAMNAEPGSELLGPSTGFISGDQDHDL